MNRFLVFYLIYKKTDEKVREGFMLKIVSRKCFLLSVVVDRPWYWLLIPHSRNVSQRTSCDLFESKCGALYSDAWPYLLQVFYRWFISYDPCHCILSVRPKYMNGPTDRSQQKYCPPDAKIYPGYIFWRVIYQLSCKQFQHFDRHFF